MDRAERLAREIDACQDPKLQKELRRDREQAIRTAAVLDARIKVLAESELALWSELWETPQAVMWEQLAWSREVAQYVRWKVRGEMGDLDAAKEARQWSDRLGLNPLALLRLRWEIERAEEAEEKGTRRRQVGAAVPRKSGGADPRAALRAV